MTKPRGIGVYCYIRVGAGRGFSKTYPACIGMQTSFHGRIVAVGRDHITTQWSSRPPQIRRCALLVSKYWIRVFHGEPEER